MIMLQHPASDFYDLSTANATAVLSTRQITPPPYSPNTANTTSDLITPVALNNNNKNNLEHLVERNGTIQPLGNQLSCQTTVVGNGSGSRETLPSFGFTQEQVACVCEVR